MKRKKTTSMAQKYTIKYLNIGVLLMWDFLENIMK